jgi:hopene-associated glycosyltransferase HpnB
LGTDASTARVVTAVIPARDEGGLIGRAVASLRRQRFGGTLRIVVADDDSADQTGAEAKAADAEVVKVGLRPAEWKGKLWALSEGIGHANRSADYLLLTDADIEYQSPDILAALVAHAEIGFDLVSVMVRLRCESMAEKLLIPAFVFFFFMLYPPGTPAAAGGCVLIRRETLERIGGIGSIRTALIDDCALARKVADAGGRVWLGVSDLPVRSFREYGRAADIRAMIARSAFAQLRHSVLLLAGTIVAMALTYVMPVALLFSGDAAPVALGACAWVLSAVLFMPSVREYGAPLWTVICLPGIALFYLYATVESAVQYWKGQGGMWKGRVQDSRSKNH